MSSGFDQCVHCGKSFKRAGGGITSHIKACEKKMQRERDRDEIIEGAFQDRQAHLRRLHKETMSARVPRAGPSFTLSDEIPDNDAMEFGQDDSGPLWEGSPEPIEEQGEKIPLDAMTEDDATPTNPKSFIKIHYHPRTGIPPKIVDPNEDRTLPVPSLPALSPFAPFPSEADFRIAERMVNTSASAEDINFLLGSHHDPCFVNEGASKVCFKNADQLYKCVDEYVDLHEGFVEHKFKVPHTLKDGKNVELDYSVWVKDVMLWIEELVADPALNEHWEWHASRQYLHTEGTEPERFITTPMSAEFAWETEDTLPQDPTHVLFPLIYYSDKSNAARFAQFSLHPMLLRCANLPKHLATQNSCYEGNNLFFIYPKITCPAGDEGNKLWPTTARLIAHAASGIVFRTMSEASKHGKTMHCGDGVDRTIYPLIPIATLDLEEQFMCACHQGTKATHPCPKCLVHQDAQSNLLAEAVQRNHESSIKIIEAAREMNDKGNSKGAKELLKAVSLYLVNNSWWCLYRTDIHKALSFDVLHSIWLGIWGAHLLPLLMPLLAPKDGVSRNNHHILSERIAKLPSFPNMRRMPDIAKIEFSDGKTYFTILQQILPLVHDLVPAKYLPFLRLVRTLAEISLCVQIKMQTETHLKTAQGLIERFNAELIVVQRLFPEKNFNFPKMHQLSHLLRDIRQKGTADYLGCMVGENFHQGLIKAYQASNKRDAIYQILRNESRILAISRIRWRLSVIALRNTRMSAVEPQNHVEVDDNNEELPSTPDLSISSNESDAPFEPIPLGSEDKPLERDSVWIEANRGYFNGFIQRPQFSQFHNQLLHYLKLLKEAYCESYQEPPDNDPSAALAIIPYRQIKHTYYSLDDRLPHRDHIRCAPEFYGRERFDTVLVDIGNAFRPARLHLVFNVTTYGVVWQLARVSYFTPVASTAIDRTIGMKRYEEEESGEFIHLASIIRSCYMIPIFSTPRMFYMNDLVAGDVDLFLRVK